MIQNIISYLNEYAGVFSVLLSLIAIFISITFSIQTSKQVKKQIDSLKSLSYTEIESTLIHLHLEHYKVLLLISEMDEKNESIKWKADNLIKRKGEHDEIIKKLCIEQNKITTDMEMVYQLS